MRASGPTSGVSAAMMARALAAPMARFTNSRSGRAGSGASAAGDARDDDGQRADGHDATGDEFEPAEAKAGLTVPVGSHGSRIGAADVRINRAGPCASSAVRIDLDILTVPRLVLFTRYPEPGKAKTRLIPALGPDGRGRPPSSARRADGGIHARHGPAHGDPFDRSRRDAFLEWLGHDLNVVDQGDGDLGTRLARAASGAPAILLGRIRPP